MYYNLIIVGGNLCGDPLSRDTGGGNVVAKFTVATNRRSKEREETSFIDCEAWGKTAENIAKFFGKGSPILVTGRVKSDSWQTQSGEKRQKLIMVVDRFDFVLGPNERPAEPDSKPVPAIPASSAVDSEPPF